jgi:hypothetical protein
MYEICYATRAHFTRLKAEKAKLSLSTDTRIGYNASSGENKAERGGNEFRTKSLLAEFSFSSSLALSICLCCNSVCFKQLLTDVKTRSAINA